MDAISLEVINKLLGGLNKLLDHFWTGWDKTANFLRPYKEDKKRYEHTIKSVEVNSINYFRSVDYSCIRREHQDALYRAEYELSLSKFAAYCSKKLAKKEDRFVRALIGFNAEFSLRSFVHRNTNELSTIYWDTFNEWDENDSRREAELIGQLNALKIELIQSFEDFRDYGHKLFAEKIAGEKVNG